MPRWNGRLTRNASVTLRRVKRAKVPKRMRWLFWNVDFDKLDVNRDIDAILARVLEFGRLEDVRWALRTYGRERIHTFFRTVGSPEISERTVTFWRAVFRAKGEAWPRPPAWRRSSSAPWID